MVSSEHNVEPGLEEQSSSPSSTHGVEPSAVDVRKVVRMGTAPIGRLMLEFGIPAVASVVLNALYNVIDSIFLGQAMGEVGLAATTVASPIMVVLIALSVLAGNGGNSLAAIMLGEDRRDAAEKTLGNAFTIIIIESIFVALVATFWLDPILRLVGATDRILPYAHVFTQIICYGFILQNIAMGVNNFIRTAGEPNRALWTMVVGTIVCIGLNYLFVMVLGWGVAGSALATIIGQGVSAVFVLQYFIFNRRAPFSLKLHNLRLEAALFRKICSLGLAPFALQAAAAVVQVFGNSMLAYLGSMDPIGTDGALAAIGVVMKISMFAVFPVIGVAIAAQPILGFNVGARRYDRVLKTLRLALVVATIILVFFFACMHLFPEAIVGLFGVEDNLLSFAVLALKVQTLFIPLIGLQIIGSNYFQATGQPMRSTILSLTRQFICLLPALMIAPFAIPAVFPQVSRLMGFCIGFPIADGLSIFLCTIFLVAETARLKKTIIMQERSA